MTISRYKAINLQKTHVFWKLTINLTDNFLVHNFYGKFIYYIIDINIVPETFFYQNIIYI